MCFKYEDEYGKCWDYLTYSMLPEYADDSIPGLLEREWNVRVLDKDALDHELMLFFVQMHEKGIIGSTKSVEA